MAKLTMTREHLETRLMQLRHHVTISGFQASVDSLLNDFRASEGPIFDSEDAAVALAEPAAFLAARRAFADFPPGTRITIEIPRD
jgi:hypothetical protein